MKPIFVDTGAFYAKYVPQDRYHEEAKPLWGKVREDGISCFTSNFVLAELITLFVYRFGAVRALRAAKEIYGSHAVQIVSVDREMEMRGLAWLERFPDQDFSMTDAISFALTEEKGLKAAFTFDHHFDIAGFERFR